MNSIERLDAALAGVEVDRPPFSFWYNFGLQHMSGEAVADAHIAFAKRFRPDFLRVMNSYPYPLGSGSRSFDRATDLLRIPAVTAAEDGYWGHQLRALNKIVKALKGEIWAVESIDSPWTHLCRLSNRSLVFNTASRRPEIVKAALDVISASQVKYVQKAMETGIKGIFFTVTEAGYDALDPIKHEELCKPYNERILEAASELPFNVLRLEGGKLYFDTLTDYPTSVVSWSHFRTLPGLVKGLLEWKRCVMGGINYETLCGESPESLRGYFEKYAEEFFINKMIIAPSGALPSDISPYILDGLIDAIESLRSMGRFLRPEMLKVKSAAKRPGVEEYYTKTGKAASQRGKLAPDNFESIKDTESKVSEDSVWPEESEPDGSVSAGAEAAETPSAVFAGAETEAEKTDNFEDEEAGRDEDFGVGVSPEKERDFGIVSVDDFDQTDDIEEFPSAPRAGEPVFPSLGFRRADYDSEGAESFEDGSDNRRRFDAAFRRERKPGSERERESKGSFRGGRFEGAKRKDDGKGRGRRERSGFSGKRESYGGKNDRGSRSGFASSRKREDRFDRRGSSGAPRRERDFGGGKSRFGSRHDFDKRFDTDRKHDFSGRTASKSGSVRRVRIPRDRQR
ncbi:hypothetical protein IJT93_10665 [bacterium]|nr:hypothetical protein [bacterium]